MTLLESFPTPLPLYEKRQSLGGLGLENDCHVMAIRYSLFT